MHDTSVMKKSLNFISNFFDNRNTIIVDRYNITKARSTVSTIKQVKGINRLLSICENCY